MKLKIENYRNISSLEFDVVPSKINCIFGISGSGKSSIAMAFSRDDLLPDKGFRFVGAPSATIDGCVLNPCEVGVFNTDTLDSVFVERSQMVYEVLIDDKQQYRKAQSGLDQLVSNLRTALLNEQSAYEQSKEFITLCGAKKLNKGDTISQRSPLANLIKANKKLSNSRVFEEVSKIGHERFGWITQGYKWIDPADKKCPFCGKIVSKRYFRKLGQYAEYEHKSLSVFQSYAPKFVRRGGGERENIATNVLRRIEEEAIRESIAYRQYELLNELTDSLFDENSNWSDLQKQFRVKKELFEVFPALKSPYGELKNHIRSLAGKYKEAKEATEGILFKRLKAVNRWIARFGIPYRIKAKYKKDEITEYKLVHTDDCLDGDSSHRLSTGERNIISLLFFVLAATGQQYKIIFIDDPVSSYDECRRQQIMSLFSELLAGKTLVVLSHDSVFAKYVVNDRYRRGNVSYFENYDGITNFRPIGLEDFGDFDFFVEEHAKSVSEYYRKIMCLRLLYEGKYNSVAYGYLSSILHGCDKQTICVQLERKFATEESVVSAINQRYPGIGLVPFEEEYLRGINIDELSFFEKAIFLREQLGSSKEEKDLKKELSDLVHLNKQLKVCLNPFIFVICAPSTYKTVVDRAKGSADLCALKAAS